MPIQPPLPASPCISVCQMDADTHWCRGCYRTIDEIAHWASSDPATRAAVWQALAQRRALVHFPEAVQPADLCTDQPAQ